MVTKKSALFIASLISVSLLFFHTAQAAPKKKQKASPQANRKTSDRPPGLSGLIPAGKVGIALYSLRDRKMIFGHNEKEPLNPASCQKILTAMTAFKTLGTDYTFKTTYLTDSLSGKSVNHLYVKGGGDPVLVQERLLELGKSLYDAGLREVRGDIIVDNSYFDSNLVDGKLGDSAEPYTAQVSALAVNFNSFKVVTNTTGGSASVQVDPPLDYFVLNASVKKGRGGFYVNRTYKDGRENVIAKGHATGISEQYATVSNPAAYAGYAIKWALESAGIKVKGGVKEGVATSGLTTLFVDESKPVTQALTDMNKFSNNFIAEMTLKTIGASVSGVPASTSKGAEVVRRYLSSLDVDESEYAIVNGSGLSRQNRISAHALLEVLVDGYTTASVRDAFMNTLPVAGVDGTLKSRLKGTELRGNVRAKTGTLSGVSSLAGYVTTKHGNDLAFVMLMNGAMGGGGGYHDLQDRLLKMIYEIY